LEVVVIHFFFTLFFLFSPCFLSAMVEPGPSSRTARAHIALENTPDGSTLEFVNGAAAGELSIVQAYVEAGIDVNVRAFHECTALLAAAKNGHKEIVQLLLEHGADVNTLDADGCCALRRAFAQGHAEIVELLLDNGASVDFKNPGEQTAFSYGLKRVVSDVRDGLLVNTHVPNYRLALIKLLMQELSNKNS
jgi:ankyrin repeat protein